MNPLFAQALKNVIGHLPQKEAAARMGISAPQLCKVLQGIPVERTTLVKIFAGVSEKQPERVNVLAAWLRDQKEIGGADGGFIDVFPRLTEK